MSGNTNTSISGIGDNMRDDYIDGLISSYDFIASTLLISEFRNITDTGQKLLKTHVNTGYASISTDGNTIEDSTFWEITESTDNWKNTQDLGDSDKKIIMCFLKKLKQVREKYVTLDLEKKKAFLQALGVFLVSLGVLDKQSITSSTSFNPDLIRALSTEGGSVIVLDDLKEAIVRILGNQESS